MKKKYLYILMLPTVLLTAACSQKNVTKPSLDITLDVAHFSGDTAYVYKLGDTCKFQLSGYAENLTVYNGMPGHNYSQRNRTNGLGQTQLSFSTATIANQGGTLQVLATDNLARVDSAHVISANWTDITSRAVLATSTTAVPSGIVNLTDIVKSPSDSLFIAFKYTGNIPAGTSQKPWTITNYAVNELLTDGASQTVSNLSIDNAYWTKVKGNPTSVLWTNSTSNLQLSGLAAATNNDISWIVSKPIHPGQLAQDFASGILNLSSGYTKQYILKYTAAGTYLCTFVVFNNTIDGQNTQVKQFKIVVH